MRTFLRAVQPALEGPWADDIARMRLGSDAPVETVAALREICTPDVCASLLHMGLTEMHEILAAPLVHPEAQRKLVW